MIYYLTSNIQTTSMSYWKLSQVTYPIFWAATRVLLSQSLKTLSPHFALKSGVEKSLPSFCTWHLRCSIYFSSPSISLSFSLSLLLSARDQYWCGSRASVAKVLNWHDRAIKEPQRSILPSFTLLHRPLFVHSLHTLTDKRQILNTLPPSLQYFVTHMTRTYPTYSFKPS